MSKTRGKAIRSVAASIGPLPRNWKLVRLGDLARESGRYGSSAAALAYDADLPRYIRITDITRDGILHRDSPASIAVPDAEPHRLKRGDLLFARSGATCGKTYLYNPRDGECAYAGYLIRFSLDETLCVPSFVARWTQSSFYQAWLARTIRKAAQANINADELADLPVPLPPVEEQLRITNMLAVLDRIILSGEAIIEKLGNIRIGLVTDLLSCGVDDDGQIINKRELRDSPIGPIPAHYSVAPVESLLVRPGPPYRHWSREGEAVLGRDAEPDDLSSQAVFRDLGGANQDERNGPAIEHSGGRHMPAMRSGPFGSDLRKAELVDEGIPLLGIDNIGVGRFVADFKRYIRPSKYLELQRYAALPGDVMITIMGTVGRSCLVPDDLGPALSSKHVWALTFDRERYLPELASLQFNYAPWVQEHFRREEQGGTMSAIRSETLKSLLLPVPPMAEQRLIVRIVGDTSARLEAETVELGKRRRLRQSLIDDLLTGRRRLPPE
ncbi:MAG: restriction endonuclease subunit S [Proteobacteria bacterium]|nr:restriction endonuclease subunit S [Pseudomonadota bacterium]